MTRTVRVLVGTLVLACLCGPATAQRVLVETTALSALRESAAITLESVDLSSGQILPGSLPVPGAVSQGPLLVTPDGRAAVVSSGPLTGSELRPTYLTGYLTAPLQALPETALDFPGDWRQVAGAFVNDADVVVLRSRLADDGTWQGRLDLRPFTDIGLGPVSATWPLPGAPEACVSLGDGRVAVLCRGPLGSGAILHLRDVNTGAVSSDLAVADPGADRWGAVPAGLKPSPDGRWLYVLVSGYAADRPAGDPVSRVYRYTLPDVALSATPVEVPGLAEANAAPLTTAESGCWVATHAPDSGFAYASHIASAADVFTLDVQTPYFNVDRPLRIAPAPTGPAVAVAINQRLEIWPQGKPGGPNTAFASSVETLRWTEEGLFAGEGNRLSSIDPATALPVTAVSFPTGLVTDLVPIPASDAAAPLRLALPTVVVLHGESVGQELRAVRVDADAWQVEVDREQAPWLSVYPLQGKAGEAFYMGVDAARYPADSGLLQALVTVRLGDRSATVRVEVAPAPGEVPGVLWLLDPRTNAQATTPQGLDGLGKLLTNAPLRFREYQERGSVAGDLSPYRVVVVTAEAIARGRLTRQALLDYVAEGGGALLLAARLPQEESAVVERWLGPLGIYFDPAAGVDGRFTTASRDWLCRNWTAFDVREGAGVRTDHPENVLVPGPTGSGLAVFEAVSHGRGRLAVLASPTPLENGSLQNAENRRFAADLFRWLARIGTEYEDVDGDGVPDRVEDANGNGTRDPGETDRLAVDSDGDGLPDGVEDANRNGKCDEGETSPLNADSDGDALPDGADVEPLPAAEAPVVHRMEPAEGSAEGGTTVFVSGRNFGPDTQLWIGDRPVLGLRRFGDTALAAEVPAFVDANGGDVDIRVTNSATGLTGILPGGYRYTPRSTVRLIAQADSPDTLSIRLESAPGVLVGRVGFRVDVDPRGALQWLDAVPGAAAEVAGRRIETRPDPNGGIWVDVSPARTPSGGGELVVLHCQPTTGEHRVSLYGITVLAPNGEPLNVATE